MGPVSALIIVAAGLVQAPGIEQCVRRPGIKTDNRFALPGREPGDVRNAPKIQNAAILLRRTEQPAMKGRNQRGTLTMGSHVPRTEIGNGGYAGGLGNPGGIANLHGERRGAGRLMADSLPVAADGADLLRVDSGLVDKVAGGLGKVLAGEGVQFANFIRV